LSLSPLHGSGADAARAEPGLHGFASPNVEHVLHLPLEAGTATGMRLVGSYLYVTSWKSFSIYDVSEPMSPRRLSTTPFGFAFENEDVATNGKILLFSEQLPRNLLHVWDVEDKTQPVEIATLAGGGGHTQTCVLGCRFAYGSEGVIVDLRDPIHPKIAGSWVPTGTEAYAHDVTEVAPGIVLTAGKPMLLLDARRDPSSPKVIASAYDDTYPIGLHSADWPNKGQDAFILGSNENLASGRCDLSDGDFSVWRTRGFERTRTFTLVDTWALKNGTHSDGSPVAGGMGCSAHWFDEHPRFASSGAVVLGAYEHGTRFLHVDRAGAISEKGWFVPHAGETSAAYWLTNRLVYAVDYARGIDVLRYEGALSGAAP
jgi:hypothetical protein